MQMRNILKYIWEMPHTGFETMSLPRISSQNISSLHQYSSAYFSKSAEPLVRIHSRLGFVNGKKFRFFNLFSST